MLVFSEVGEAWLLLKQQRRGAEVPLVARTQLEAIPETCCAGRQLKPHVFTGFSHCSSQLTYNEEIAALVLYLANKEND